MAVKAKDTKDYTGLVGDNRALTADGWTYTIVDKPVVTRRRTDENDAEYDAALAPIIASCDDSGVSAKSLAFTLPTDRVGVVVKALQRAAHRAGVTARKVVVPHDDVSDVTVWVVPRITGGGRPRKQQPETL